MLVIVELFSWQPASWGEGRLLAANCCQTVVFGLTVPTNLLDLDNKI